MTSGVPRVPTDRSWIGRLRFALGYGALGIASTAAVALGILYGTSPLQALVYRWSYLAIGPSQATELAILAQFLLGAGSGLAVAALLAHRIADGELDRRFGTWTVGLLAMVVVGFLLVGYLGGDPMLTAVVLVTGVAIGVPVAVVRSRRGSPALPAAVGGLPVVLLLLAAAGFGIGWGWGYVVVAEEVPVKSIEDPTAVGNFSAAEWLATDLFAPDNCEIGVDGAQRCILQLRGYESEVQAVRFLAEHGVRCPFQNARIAKDGGTTVLRNGETFYRVTCAAHGD